MIAKKAARASSRRRRIAKNVLAKRGVQRAAVEASPTDPVQGSSRKVAAAKRLRTNLIYEVSVKKSVVAPHGDRNHGNSFKRPVGKRLQTNGAHLMAPVLNARDVTKRLPVSDNAIVRVPTGTRTVFISFGDVSVELRRSDFDELVGLGVETVTVEDLIAQKVAREFASNGREARLVERLDSESQEYYDDLGPWATGKAVKSAFGMSWQTLSNWREERRILGVAFSRNYYYPVQQFDDGRIVDGLQDVLTMLSPGFRSPEGQAGWLAEAAYEGSAETRWDVLRSGQRDTVVAWAQEDAVRLSQA